MRFLILFSLLFSQSLYAKSQSLQAQLEELAKKSSKRTPAEVKKVMSDAITSLKKSQTMQTALKRGQRIPTFSLPDVTKGQVSAQRLLRQGPLVVTFYRGGWCPYCNLQLRDLQKHLKEIKAQGADLLAISPETPDNSLTTAKKQSLDFYVLSDVGNKVARSFGLVYELPKNLTELYKKFGIDLQKVNASKKWELPISATYVVDKQGVIRYAFVNADYKKRADTKTLISELKKLKNKKS